MNPRKVNATYVTNQKCSNCGWGVWRDGGYWDCFFLQSGRGNDPKDVRTGKYNGIDYCLDYEPLDRATLLEITGIEGREK